MKYTHTHNLFAHPLNKPLLVDNLLMLFILTNRHNLNENSDNDQMMFNHFNCK